MSVWSLSVTNASIALINLIYSHYVQIIELKFTCSKAAMEILEEGVKYVQC